MTAALLDRPHTRQPASRNTSRPARPQLRVLDRAASRRRARHRTALLILFVAVLAGFFAVALVHAELVGGQQELDALRDEISQAEAHHAELARAVEEASAPAVIVDRATELGMVGAERPVYLETAVPLRQIEVVPALATPTDATAQVAAPTAAVSATPSAVHVEQPDDLLRGSLGVAGGISAAVRLVATPALALGAETESVVVADPTTAPTAQTDSSAGTPVSAGASVSASTSVPADSPPVSSFAGSRAVVGQAGGGSTANSGDTPGSTGLASVAAATAAG